MAGSKDTKRIPDTGVGLALVKDSHAIDTSSTCAKVDIFCMS